MRGALKSTQTENIAKGVEEVKAYIVARRYLIYESLELRCLLTIHCCSNNLSD